MREPCPSAKHNCRMHRIHRRAAVVVTIVFVIASGMTTASASSPRSSKRKARSWAAEVGKSGHQLASRSIHWSICM